MSGYKRNCGPADPAAVHRTVALMLLALVLTACTPGDEATTGEPPPFFEADRFGSGPLTLEELNITLPDELEMLTTESQRDCFFGAVARRAEAAGDPADIDPDEHVYWGGNVSRDEWKQHSRHMQRVLLAQGIVSWAMIDCTE